MNLMEIIKKRRSIRKYQARQIGRSDLETIVEAGISAPNAGGGQRSIVVGVRDAALAERIGKMNYAPFDRKALIGSYVSREQPSIIDDPKIQNGFYGAPSVCIVFSQRNFLFGIPDAFCCAENMVLQATELGIASCIVSRAEETFVGEEGQRLLAEWNIPENYIARCFVILGYCEGDYPAAKPIRPGRSIIIE